MRLSEDDIKHLKFLWRKGISHRKPYYIGTKVKVGELITTTFYPELEDWVRGKFGIKGAIGGQIARLTKPLSVHADVLFDVQNHFTRSMPSTTRYVVLDTDATAPMYTVLFKQYVNRDEWTGLKDGIHAIQGLTATPLMEGYPHEKRTFSHLLKKSRVIGLTIDRKIGLGIGDVVQWPSHYLHCGCSFAVCKATYKLHLTVLAPDG